MGLTVVPGNMIEDGTVTDSNFDNTTITSADMALDPRNASNISSGEVAAARLGNVDLTGLEDDTALLGFKTAANGSLAKYNLLDQTVDAFEDASGVDSGSSTNAERNASKYYSGASSIQEALTTVASSSWTAPAAIESTMHLLVVAGGASAGQGGWTPGAGGAGGLVYISNYAVTGGQAYTYTVGAGGLGKTFDNSNQSRGNEGSNSVFDGASFHQTITANGGGAGGSYPSGQGASAGGSGGGGGANTNSGQNAGGATNQPTDFGSYTGVGFGFAGGTGNPSAWKPAAGGGGAGGVGDNYNTRPSSASGNGGAGKDMSAVFGTGVGDQGWFAGGGGGGGMHDVADGHGFGNGGSGLYGGGGTGTQRTGTPAATAGAANTGGGGGGGRTDTPSPAGGSGVIILKYNTAGNMTLVSTATTAQAAPTKGDIVFTYTNGAGTAVINTNITAEISADNGSTWTTFSGLTSQGTTGGHTIVSAHDQTISSTITAPYNMKYRIKTLVQSASMQTRIQAVSLGWS